MPHFSLQRLLLAITLFAAGIGMASLAVQPSHSSNRNDAGSHGAGVGGVGRSVLRFLLCRSTGYTA